MARLEKLMRSLRQGMSVRRAEWEPVIRMYLAEDTLMCQCGASKPWRCALSWDEIAATDWQLTEDASAVHRAERGITEVARAEPMTERALANSGRQPKLRFMPRLFLFRSK